jgi:hypothetical protein
MQTRDLMPRNEKRPACWCCGGYEDRIDGSPDECDCDFEMRWTEGEREVGIAAHSVECCTVHGHAND